MLIFLLTQSCVQATMEIVWLCFLFLIKFTTAGPCYDVLDYQAVGDGTTDDTDVLFILFSLNCST
jgi:hypothetical protein